MAYEYTFASVYDIFTEGVNYSERADYICRIFSENGISEGTVLDVACGTGSLSECFLKKGYDVIASDISVEMLNIAREKLAAYEEHALIVCQDMRDLDLYGTVDCAVCALDSVNHIITKDEIEDVFSGLGMFIRPGGILVFDVNTIYKHREILSGNTFVYEDDNNAFLVWQNSECDSDDIIDMCVDVFKKNINGSYDRFTDYITERAYPTDFFVQMLEKYGFCDICVYGDMKFMKPDNNEERIYFSARKK